MTKKIQQKKKNENDKKIKISHTVHFNLLKLSLCLYICILYFTKREVMYIKGKGDNKSNPFFPYIRVNSKDAGYNNNI